MPLFRAARQPPRPIVELSAEMLGTFMELRLVIEAADGNALEGRELVLNLYTADGAVTVRARISRRSNLEVDAERAIVSLILARGLALTGWRAVVGASRRGAPIAAGEGTIAPEARVLVA